MGDNITRPDHYCEGREYEPKDVIRDWGLNFNLGSAVKYISRAGRKGDKLEDLKKAKRFLEFEIEAAEKEEHKDNIGMTCKEAAEIGEAIAKSIKDGIKETEDNRDESELDIYGRGFEAGYDMAHTDLRSVEDTVTISIANQSPKRIDDLQDRSYMFLKSRGIRMW